MTILVDEKIILKSKAEALEICHKSRNLKSIKEIEYNKRRDSFETLVTDKGYHVFKPFITISVVEDFKKMFLPISRSWYKKYLLEDDEEKQEVYHKLYRLSEFLYQTLTNENIINGVMTEDAMEFAKSLNLKGYNSPKLSKTLIKLCSEKSRFWSWYTNTCPKEIVMGEDTNKNVVVSVLPHHVAGMAYYSSYNFGGRQWTGWQGTSCQDPTRNNGGSAMFNLPSSIKDESLAVAYLSDGETHDIFKPVYEARILIRVVELKNGNIVYIALRPFGYKESIAYLTDALKNKFPGILFTAQEVRSYQNKRGNKNLTINLKVEDVRYESSDTCSRCDGDGEEGNGDTCTRCDGTGYRGRSGDFYSPYNDDRDIWDITQSGTNVKYTIPKMMLVEAGLYEEKVSKELAEQEAG